MPHLTLANASHIHPFHTHTHTHTCIQKQIEYPFQHPQHPHAPPPFPPRLDLLLTWLAAIVDHSNDWTPWKIVWPTIDRSHRDSTSQHCVRGHVAPAAPACCKRSAAPQCNIRAGTICNGGEEERGGDIDEKWLYHNNIDWKPVAPYRRHTLRHIGTHKHTYTCTQRAAVT